MVRVGIQGEEQQMTAKVFTAMVFASTLALACNAFAIPGDEAPAPKAKTSDPAKPSAKKLKCKRGETAKKVTSNGKEKYSCVKLNAGVLPDNELYQQARLLADEGEYEWALDHLRAIRIQHNAEVLNYTGYANRKAGRLETGIAYYQQALAINPDYVQAREYLGEAYVLAGFDAEARRQLKEIEHRGGVESEAYVALRRFIEQGSGQ
jgi:tetratricopeptide (TPR) repeat protein